MYSSKLLVLLLLLLVNLQAWSQKWIIVEKNVDSVNFTSNQILITVDTILFSVTDTFAVFKKGDKYRLKDNPYSKSETFYDSLQVKSFRNKITKELYNLVMRSKPVKVHDTSNFDKSETEYIQYKGFKIRNIRLKKVDVLEGSVTDTSEVAESFIGKSANDVHLNTRDYVIYNNLAINEGDLVDPVKLADNERILRNSPYLEDARIYILPLESDSNIVDLLIVTKDKFSVGIGLDYSGLNNFRLFLYDRNFLGVGHEMRHYLIYNSGYSPQVGYAFRYGVNNILNSFTSARFDYENSWDRNFIRIKVNKDFLTQQTKYGGGISLYQIADDRIYSNIDTSIIVNYKTFNQDYWIGRAFQVGPNGTTFNTSIRFANANFKNRPIVTRDSNYFYRDQSIVLASFTLLMRKYYLSNLVFGFGVTEDIPYGYKFNFMFGFEKDQFLKRPYFSGSVAYGKHYKFPGYLLLNAEYGSFYGSDETQDRVVKFRILNIGNLHRFSRYSIRTFFDLNFQMGSNMSDPESKTAINGRWTSIVSGLNKEGLKGNQKTTVSFESVLFTPWYLLGFKFAMLTYVDLGWISQKEIFGQNTSLCASIGAGVRIKNESWIFETITLGFAYFIRAPEGSSRFGYILDSSDPRLFRDLNPGRPEIVIMDQSPTLFLD